MKSYTPTEARDLLVKLFEAFPNMGRAVLRGADLEEFNAAADAAEVVSRRQPTTSTCRELEQCLGLMFNLVFDSPLFKAKPLCERQLMIDCIEIAGSALAVAANTRERAGTNTYH